MSDLLEIIGLSS